MIWDAKTGALIGEPLKGSSDCLNSVCFSPDGTRIVTGGSNKRVMIWDAKSSALIGEPLKGH